MNCPTIKLSKREKFRIRRPWKQSLIVLKLLGRTIEYNLLLRKIKEMWRPKAAVDLVAIDNDYFFVKFSSMEDNDFAKY